MSRTRSAMILAAALVLGGCGAIRTRPATLDDARAHAENAKSEEAKRFAPQRFAEAEALRTEAEQKYKAGDAQAAQFLAEQAIAAYERAFAEARRERAAALAASSKGELDEAAKELVRLRDEQAKAAADLAALEAKIRVAREAPKTTPPEPADPARDAARAEAARSSLAEGRLLCASARLLGATDEALKEADELSARAEKALSEGQRPVPVDLAMDARAACLAGLTKQRAGASRGDEAETLMDELSREGSLAPVRDDRGVVVTLRDVFEGEGLSAKGREKLEQIGKIAAAHKDAPILLVVHASSADDKRDEKRAEAAKAAVAKHRGEKLGTAVAGTRRPVVDPRHDRKKNERLEVVFVDRAP